MLREYVLIFDIWSQEVWFLLFIFKQRNVKDLITFLDEFSAMVDKKTLMEIYKIATEQKYNFLYINLLASDADHMFYWNLDKRMIVSELGD